MVLEKTPEGLLDSKEIKAAPSRQRREGAGRALEEQLQRRPSSSWEQEGPSSCGGAVGEMGGIRGAPPLPGTPASCPQGTPHSQTTERLREIFLEPSGF